MYSDCMTTLTDLRKRRAMTQAELAERVGVRPETISTWETGAYRPSAPNLRALALALGCDTETVWAAIEAGARIANEGTDGKSTPRGN